MISCACSFIVLTTLQTISHSLISSSFPPPIPQALPQLSDSDDEAIRQQAMNREEQYYVNDFDMMMAKKKEEGGKQRRRKNNVDIINDNEEHIAIIVKKVSGGGRVGKKGRKMGLSVFREWVLDWEKGGQGMESERERE